MEQNIQSGTDVQLCNRARLSHRAPRDHSLKPTSRSGTRVQCVNNSKHRLQRAVSDASLERHRRNVKNSRSSRFRARSGSSGNYTIDSLSQLRKQEGELTNLQSVGVASR